MPGRRRKTPFMNRLSMNERESIIGLLRLGWKQRRIARETGFHRATIRRIARELAAELQSVREVGGAAPSGVRDLHRRSAVAAQAQFQKIVKVGQVGKEEAGTASDFDDAAPHRRITFSRLFAPDAHDEETLHPTPRGLTCAIIRHRILLVI